MPESKEAQRFDALLDAMLRFPGPDASAEERGPASDEPEDGDAED